MKNIFKFAGEVKSEAKKVSWPSFADTRNMTAMVLLLVFVCGVYLWIADWLLGLAVRTVTSWF